MAQLKSIDAVFCLTTHAEKRAKPVFFQTGQKGLYFEPQWDGKEIEWELQYKIKPLIP